MSEHISGAATRIGLGAGLIGVVALGLAACVPPHPHHRRDEPLKVLTSLDCPEDEGDLSRKSVAADGKSCIYTDSDGSQVTLQLVSLNGLAPKAALAGLETQLKSEMPPPAARTTAAGPQAADSDRVDIDLPGIHIHKDAHGRADVDAIGVHVKADDTEGSKGAAQINVDAGMGHGGVVVDANDQGAQIRIDERGSGVRLSFILASDAPGPHGYHVVGYEARGPVGGPLVVASLLGKGEDHDDLHHQVRELLRRNVGD